MISSDLYPSPYHDTDRPLTYAEKLHPHPPYVWRPVLTEQQKADQEAYIKEHNLPF